MMSRGTNVGGDHYIVDVCKYKLGNGLLYEIIVFRICRTILIVFFSAVIDVKVCVSGRY